jgi:glycosyltransferase involved in cell wall biosynthesis
MPLKKVTSRFALENIKSETAFPIDCNHGGKLVAQVSAIMPVYNDRQTFSDLDIFVADDGSTDGTFEVLQSMAEADPRIRLLRTLKNLGAYHARALALNEVRSEWVTLLDADDWYEADRIEVLLNAAKELKADLILDHLQLFDHILNKVVYAYKFIFRLDNPLLGSS